MKVLKSIVILSAILIGLCLSTTAGLAQSPPAEKGGLFNMFSKPFITSVAVGANVLIPANTEQKSMDSDVGKGILVEVATVPERGGLGFVVQGSANFSNLTSVRLDTTSRIYDVFGGVRLQWNMAFATPLDFYFDILGGSRYFDIPTYGKENTLAYGAGVGLVFDRTFSVSGKYTQSQPRFDRGIPSKFAYWSVTAVFRL